LPRRRDQDEIGDRLRLFRYPPPLPLGTRLSCYRTEPSRATAAWTISAQAGQVGIVP
jgi:hypothetical protein